MKKISISLVLFLFISCFGFAGISFKLGSDFIGVGYGVSRDPFSESNKTSFDIAVSPPFFSNLSVQMLGEFKSDDLKPFHFFIGGEMGVKAYLFMDMQLLGGFSYHLADTEKHRLELVTTFGLGTIMAITYPVISGLVDLQFVPQNRKGFYWGFGVSMENLISDMKYYKKFGLEYTIVDVTGICANIGWKL